MQFKIPIIILSLIFLIFIGFFAVDAGSCYIKPILYKEIPARADYHFTNKNVAPDLSLRVIIPPTQVLFHTPIGSAGPVCDIGKKVEVDILKDGQPIHTYTHTIKFFDPFIKNNAYDMQKAIDDMIRNYELGGFNNILYIKQKARDFQNGSDYNIKIANSYSPIISIDDGKTWSVLNLLSTKALETYLFDQSIINIEPTQPEKTRLMITFQTPFTPPTQSKFTFNKVGNIFEIE